MNESLAGLSLLLVVVVGLLTFVVTLWIMWAIIRGAVLSALRKDRREQVGG